MNEIGRFTSIGGAERERQMPSGNHDFDFFHGAWTVKHRRLKDRLVGCTEWEVFGGHARCSPILGGFGNIDDNFVDLPSGAYRAITLRTFDPVDQKWSIWWLDGRFPAQLDAPMVGAFESGSGTFLASDNLNGRPILVKFEWSAGTHPVWRQGFSADDGENWEENWIMEFAPDGAGVIRQDQIIAA
jgi:hypothetical protein